MKYTEGSGLGYAKAAVFLVEPLSNNLVRGEQAREIGYFKTIPQKTLPEVKKFLKQTLNAHR